ncbi:MAG: type II toxin-antitoxin system RelE/ParE family toxin [Rhodospirillales bacterium]
MKLRFTRGVLENLAEIADYLHANNPTAAVRVRAAIYESLQQLMLFPSIGSRKRPGECASW